MFKPTNGAHFHFIGIGGIGMSALARILLQQGMSVSGSDLKASSVTNELGRLGAKIVIGHEKGIVKQGMEVVYTTGIDLQNPEYLDAQRLQCKLWHRSDLLAAFLQQTKGLAIAGTHGKTTTSSLLAWVLSQAKANPSFAIGGVIPQLQTNGHWSNGPYFVAEACESDGTFLKYQPFGAIITNIDDDHITFFGSRSRLIAAFEQFICQVLSPSHLFWCGDDHYLSEIAPEGICYGFNAGCHLQGFNFRQQGLSGYFDIRFHGIQYKNVCVSLSGQHNAVNALGVFGLAIALGLNEQDIRQGLSSFAGVRRRCEVKGETNGILVIDDYGHHPTEIRATLQGLRNAFPDRRLVVVYQPHRYSRAQECMGHYEHAFDGADVLILSSLYAAGEQPISGISDESIYSDIVRDLEIPHQLVDRSQLLDAVQKTIKPGDVLLTLGAGDITLLGGELLESLSCDEAIL